MPIPRFQDKDREAPCEIVLFCPGCGWAIPEDKVSESWEDCQLCGATLVIKKIFYPNEAGLLHLPQTFSLGSRDSNVNTG